MSRAVQCNELRKLRFIFGRLPTFENDFFSSPRTTVFRIFQYFVYINSTSIVTLLALQQENLLTRLGYKCSSNKLRTSITQLYNSPSPAIGQCYMHHKSLAILKKLHYALTWPFLRVLGSIFLLGTHPLFTRIQSPSSWQKNGVTTYAPGSLLVLAIGSVEVLSIRGHM